MEEEKKGNIRVKFESGTGVCDPTEAAVETLNGPGAIVGARLEVGAGAGISATESWTTWALTNGTTTAVDNAITDEMRIVVALFSGESILIPFSFPPFFLSCKKDCGLATNSFEVES